MVSHSSHLWDGSKLQIEDSCWIHTQDRPCILGVHHVVLHLQVHHSLLLLHHTDSLEYNISCRQNYDLCISDLEYKIFSQENFSKDKDHLEEAQWEPQV